MASGNVEDEIAALRAAAAKARGEAAQLSKDIGKEFVMEEPKSSAKAVVEEPAKKLSPAESLALISKIDFDGGNASTQSTALDDLLESRSISLWKNAVIKNAVRPYPVTLNFLEQRSDGKLTAETLGVGGEMDVSMDDFKYATLYVTGLASVLGVASLAFLPENIGATFCYFFALIPILFIGVGSSAPGFIAGAIGALKRGKDNDEARVDRVCRHEAAHFLCGYLCGLPVKRYSITDEGFPCVEFHVSGEETAISPNRELSQSEIATMSVVAMSGSVAEAMAFEKARGGENDLIELDQLFRQSEDFMGAQKQQDYTRWGALAAYGLIKDNLGAYDKLVTAFKEKKSVAECVVAIESA